MKTIGLTGGIASGKSAVAEIFRSLGVPVIDADQIARELSAPGGAAHEAIVARFGTDDRNKLREMVFSKPGARKDLEAILHPLIQEESQKRIAACGDVPLVIYEAALLVETGRYRELDGLIVVDAPRDLRLERLIKRDGHTPELAEQILSSQANDMDRLYAATQLIPNMGTLEDLKARVAEVFPRL